MWVWLGFGTGFGGEVCDELYASGTGVWVWGWVSEVVWGGGVCVGCGGD